MEDFEATTEILGFVPSGSPGAQPGRQLCLVVVSGPEKGAVFQLSPGQTTIGRSAQHADIVVSGRGLSRAHARITLSDEEQVQVDDLDSTNGLFINGQKTQQGVLEVGDSLTLGPDVSLRLDAPDQSIQSLLREMHRGATLDSLTGVLNRRSFMERLTQEASATSRHLLQTCLALIDIDYFKKVNDTHGHPAGDAVLVGVSQRLARSLRQEDVLARFGGEEFVLLLRQTHLEGGLILLERLRRTIAEGPFEVPSPAGKVSLSVSFSAGLTNLSSSDTPETVLERVDVALYEAKKTGRNRVVVRQALESS